MTTDQQRRDELAAQVVTAAQLMFTSGVMSHSGHANMSARLDGNRFLLTTTGSVLEGDLAVENAEIVAMHSVVYQQRPDISAIIHTHSPAATAFALANRPLPCRAEPLLRFGQAEDIPVMPWGPRGSDVSVRGIGQALGEHPTTSAVLLANHGLPTFGPDPMATARLVTAIEETAEAEIAAAGIGGAVDFPPGALDAVRASMARNRP